MDISKKFTDAKVLATSGMLQQSATLLDEILQQLPDHLPSLDLMGFVQYFLKQPGKAQTFCERALAIQPDHTYALKGLGMCLAAQGHVNEGVAHLRKAVSLSPGYVDARWDLAVVLLRAKRKDEAKVVLTDAMRDLPEQQPRFMKLMNKLVKTL